MPLAVMLGWYAPTVRTVMDRHRQTLPHFVRKRIFLRLATQARNQSWQIDHFPAEPTDPTRAFVLDLLPVLADAWHDKEEPAYWILNHYDGGGGTGPGARVTKARASDGESKYRMMKRSLEQVSLIADGEGFGMTVSTLKRVAGEMGFHF